MLLSAAEGPTPVRPDIFAKAVSDQRDASMNRFIERHVRTAMRRVDSIDTGWCLSGGRQMLMLASNNYLGLAGDRRLIEAGATALRNWGSSTSGSRLLNGTNSMHIELEERLAAFKGTEAAAVFPSGYMANVGLVSALVARGDVVVMDALAHASIIDGARVSQAEVKLFPHQNIARLRRLLESIPADKSVLVVVDGIYSMDGDFAKLPEVVAAAHHYGARVVVDDAHATGIAGASGRGTADHFGLDEPDLVTGTLSKSFGATGGFVAGPRSVVDFLKHNARSFIYSTSMSPVTTAALLTAVDIVETESFRRHNLWSLTRYLIAGLNQLGCNTGHSETPIVPVIVEAESDMFEMVIGLDEDDIFASPVAYPACPRNAPRIRLSLNAEHTMEDMDRVLDSFARHGRRLGVIS
jgi:8-amino-7-oxononanoate synthase